GVKNVVVVVKTTPTSRSTANFAVFDTEVEDYQTQVQNGQLGVNSGYLSHAENVRVRGAEVDGNVAHRNPFLVRGALAYTDGKYVSFPDAPVPLEATGGAATSVVILGRPCAGSPKTGATH